LLLASVSHRQQVTSTPRQISIDTHTHDIRVTGITSKLVGNMPQKFQLAATTASQQKVKKRSKQQLKKIGINLNTHTQAHTHIYIYSGQFTTQTIQLSNHRTTQTPNHP